MYGDSPLALSCTLGGRHAVVQMLLERRADVKKLNSRQLAPLYLACQRGHTVTVQLLLEGGAEVDQTDAYGRTPLSWCCYRGDYEAARLLLRQGAAVNRVDAEGRTPLFWGCVGGHKRTVQLLLAGGAEVDLMNRADKAPLYYCCIRGHLAVAQLLLVSGSRGNASRKQSKGLSRAAAKKGFHTLAVWLRSRRGWCRVQYACEAGAVAWSPPVDHLWPSSFRLTARLLAKGPAWRRTGTDVLFHMLSFCSWDWFETNLAADATAEVLGEKGEDSQEEAVLDDVTPW